MKNKIENKKLRAVIFFGSPKKDGYTAKLLNLVIKKLEGLYSFQFIDSYKLNIKPCIDCGECKKKDECIYSDFSLIDYELKTADLIIIATPIYNLSVPAPLKSIFDRMQIYFNKRFVKNIIPPIEKEKKAILIATCGSNDLRGFEIVKTQVKMIFTIINAKLEKSLCWTNTDSAKDEKEIKFKVNKVFDNVEFFKK